MAQWFALPDAPLRVTARGQWLHGNEPLPAKLANLFAAHVEPIGERAYQVRLGVELCPVAVDDAAYFVRRQELLHEGGTLVAVRLFLSDGTQELLRAESLMQGGDHALYCRVVRGGYAAPCLFAPGHYHGLAVHLEPEAATSAGQAPRYVLRMGHGDYPIAAYDARALAATLPLAG